MEKPPNLSCVIFGEPLEIRRSVVVHRIELLEPRSAGSSDKTKTLQSIAQEFAFDVGRAVEMIEFRENQTGQSGGSKMIWS